MYGGMWMFCNTKNEQFHYPGHEICLKNVNNLNKLFFLKDIFDGVHKFPQCSILFNFLGLFKK